MIKDTITEECPQDIHMDITRECPVSDMPVLDTLLLLDPAGPVWDTPPLSDWMTLFPASATSPDPVDTTKADPVDTTKGYIDPYIQGSNQRIYDVGLIQ